MTSTRMEFLEYKEPVEGWAKNQGKRLNEAETVCVCVCVCVCVYVTISEQYSSYIAVPSFLQQLEMK